MEIALKFNETKQTLIKDTKNLAFAKDLLRVPNDGSQNVSQYIAVCVVHSSVLAWISRSVHIDKVLAWLSFRKIYVPSNYELARRMDF